MWRKRSPFLEQRERTFYRNPFPSPIRRFFIYKKTGNHCCIVCLLYFIFKNIRIAFCYYFPFVFNIYLSFRHTFILHLPASFCTFRSSSRHFEGVKKNITKIFKIKTISHVPFLYLLSLMASLPTDVIAPSLPLRLGMTFLF